MTHRDKKPYECSVENCQKSYCDARSLRRHLENHHNQTPEQIQSAIAKVSSNAAAEIAAAAAANNASVKAASSTQSQVTSASNVATVPPMQSESSIGQNSNTNTQFSETSTPLASPSYQVPTQQQQPYFQYEPPPLQQPTVVQPSVARQPSVLPAPQVTLGGNAEVNQQQNQQVCKIGWLYESTLWAYMLTDFYNYVGVFVCEPGKVLVCKSFWMQLCRLCLAERLIGIILSWSVW